MMLFSRATTLRTLNYVLELLGSDLKICQGVCLVHGSIALKIRLHVFCPQRRFPMLCISLVPEHGVGVGVGVIPFVRIPIVSEPVDSPGCQHGDGGNGGDDCE